MIRVIRQPNLFLLDLLLSWVLYRTRYPLARFLSTGLFLYGIPYNPTVVLLYKAELRT
jgi:hypothetical protein